MSHAGKRKRSSVDLTFDSDSDEIQIRGSKLGAKVLSTVTFKSGKIGLNLNNNIVSFVNKGSPAMIQGVRVNWKVTAVQGQPVPAHRDSIIDLIRENSGKATSITFSHPANEKPIPEGRANDKSHYGGIGQWLHKFKNKEDQAFDSLLNDLGLGAYLTTIRTLAPSKDRLPFLTVNDLCSHELGDLQLSKETALEVVARVKQVTDGNSKAHLKSGKKINSSYFGSVMTGIVSALPFRDESGFIEVKSETNLSFGKDDIIIPWSTWDRRSTTYELKMNQQVRFILDKYKGKQIATYVRPLKLYPCMFQVVVQGVSLRKSADKEDYAKGSLERDQIVNIEKIKNNWGRLKNKLWVPLIVDESDVILEPVVCENSVMNGMEGLIEPNWSRLRLSKFKKNFYKEDPKVSDLSEEDISKWRKKKNVNIFDGNNFDGGKGVPLGADKFKPVRKYAEVRLPEYLLTEFEEAKFERPTPIQAQSWPICLRGNDMIGVADTGSGKTLSFLVPAAIHIRAQAEQEDGDGPIALVLAPTRELALQIQTEAQKFFDFNTVAVYGGADKNYQLQCLYNGASIVVATPGRLIDLLCNGHIRMNRVTYLVLDEADRMLDMGFEPQIRGILSQIRPDRQSLMFTATWPKTAKKIADDFLVNPITVNVGSMGLSSNSRVKQIVEVISEHKKIWQVKTSIKDIFKSKPDSRILVFCNTKRGTDSLARELHKMARLSTNCIHGGKDQYAREEVLESFRNGSTQVLVATDVCGRGIDIKGITHVINADFPHNCEAYVHRIGRTGRAGRSGIAISFFTDGDTKNAKGLVSILEEAGQHVPSELKKLSNRGWYKKKKGGWNKGGWNKNNSGGNYGGKHGGNYGGKHGGRW